LDPIYKYKVKYTFPRELLLRNTELVLQGGYLLIEVLSHFLEIGYVSIYHCETGIICPLIQLSYLAIEVRGIGSEVLILEPQFMDFSQSLSFLLLYLSYPQLELL
jgi:hypothetical protein